MKFLWSYPIQKNHIGNPRLYLNHFFKRELASVCGDQDFKDIDFNSFDLTYTKPIFLKIALFFWRLMSGNPSTSWSRIKFRH